MHACRSTLEDPTLPLALLICAASISEARVLVEGPEEAVALVELYTSEGCDSCPPADRWFSGLKSSAGLWREFVPVAFHVNYWDYLGWKDALAQPSFADRQRAYAYAWGNMRIYTPEMILSGDEWTGWRSQISDPGSASDAEKPGRLKIEEGPDGEWKVVFDSARKRKKLKVHLALMGMGLVSDVKSGENSGRKLKHDFAVLSEASRDAEARGLRYETRLRLPKSKSKAERLAIAAWVVESGKTKPIQAAGGFVGP